MYYYYRDNLLNNSYIYIYLSLADILVCSIAVYFYEFCSSLTSQNANDEGYLQRYCTLKYLLRDQLLIQRFLRNCFLPSGWVKFKNWSS